MSYSLDLVASTYRGFTKEHSFMYKRTALPLTDQEKSIFTFQKSAPDADTHTSSVQPVSNQQKIHKISTSCTEQVP